MAPSSSSCFVPPASSHHSFLPTPTRATAGHALFASSSSERHHDYEQRQQHQPQQPQLQHHRRELLQKAFALGGLLLGSTTVPTPLIGQGGIGGRLNFVTGPAAAGADVLGGTPLPAAEVQAMTTGKAADFIKLNCQGILQAYKETGPIPSFLYRGEDVNRPSLLKCLPDLMDPTTYVEGKEAADFFGKMETAMKDLPVKPSVGHLATNDIRSAAAWGTPVSIWPIGKEIHYAWLNDAKNFWPVPPEKRGLTVKDISACINREIQVDRGLGMAVKMGHEVMFQTGEQGFVVIPVAYEREIRARLGLGYE